MTQIYLLNDLRSDNEIRFVICQSLTKGNRDVCSWCIRQADAVFIRILS